VVAAAIIDAMNSLNLHFPRLDRPQMEELNAARALLNEEH
jgi:hypothetical protein